MKIQRNGIVTLVILALVLLLTASITFWFKYQNEHKVLDQTTAIFTNQPGEAPYSDLLGNAVALDQYLGRIMVVTSWASWSPFSGNDLQMLSELAKKYSAEDVAILAINRKETKEQASRYTNSLPELSGVLVVLDPRDIFYTAVGGYAMPETVIYNERGEVVEHFRGVTPKVEIETILDRLISVE